MQPQTDLASWQQWHGKLPVKPEISARLDGGLSNQSYLLVSGDTRMVLRLNNNDTTLPGDNRMAEATIWKAASAAGIAPPLLYFDEQAGFLVSQYIEGNLPPQPQNNKALLDQVFELISKCHSLNVTAPTLDYKQHIENYWRLIEKNKKPPTKALLNQRKPMQRLLDSLLKTNPQTALCHHDLVKANFVGNPDNLYLIDWEYAARGLAIMDYAGLAVEWNVSNDTILSQTAINPTPLAMAQQLYRYLCSLWKAIPT